MNSITSTVENESNPLYEDFVQLFLVKLEYTLVVPFCFEKQM